MSGHVFELGAGTGSNFSNYPSTVQKLTAAEPEPYLRERALAAAAEAPVEVEVIDALADELPFEDATFDAAIACLVLCTVPDQARALAELRRVVRPGGELRFYEHVHANSQPLKAVLEFVDRTQAVAAASRADVTGRATPSRRSSARASRSSTRAASRTRRAR